MAVGLIAAQAIIDEVQSSEFSQIVALFDRDPRNDPNGDGTARGHQFDFDEVGSGARMRVEIELPLGSDGLLHEDVEIESLGLPRDLNGDGVVSTEPVSDPCLLPVAVTVSWDSEGARSIILRNVVSRR